MAGFLLQTLGVPEIRSDDRPIKLNLRKGLALLIYLAEARGAVARDLVATLLWPESPRETGRARLRRTARDDARLVEVDVRLDQARTAETATRIMLRRVDHQPRLDGHDAAARDADVERLARAIGQPRIADDEVHRPPIARP